MPLSHSDGPSTEHEAAAKVAPFAQILREKIAHIFFKAERGGHTAGEIVAMFPDVHEWSVRPRISDLKRLNLIAPTGARRENKRGNNEEALRWIGPADISQVSF